ncbi:MAG: YgiT-type zinc finger protein [Euryarchaeota archaeon]|nr:YgiT-type zinc finger protein [Euryarchaeota archaeon]
MKCAICRRKLVVIEDVPANVCENCGEKYFSAKVSKEIDKLLESDVKVKEN